MREDVFSEIYSKHSWGGGSRSGPGSDPESTKPYVQFVNKFIKLHPKCRKVVEIGCGDWATSQLIKIAPKSQYIGYDIVQGVVDENIRHYGSESIRFICADFLRDNIEEGDLLLIKDVLQHLPNHAVQQFIERTLPKFEAAIITNDVQKFRERTIAGIPFKKTHFEQPNTDIPDGKSRPLRLGEPPFNLQATECKKYRNVFAAKDDRAVFVKEIFVWTRNGNP